MTIPVLHVAGFLFAPIQEALEDSVALQLKHDLLAELQHSQSRGVMIDVSGVDIVDSFTARLLSGISRAVRLMGARTVLVGLQPEVAMTMVDLGLELPDIATELDADRGLQLLQAELDGHTPEEPDGAE